MRAWSDALNGILEGRSTMPARPQAIREPTGIPTLRSVRCVSVHLGGAG